MLDRLNPPEKRAFLIICCYFREYHRFPKYRKLGKEMGYKGDISNYRLGMIYKSLVSKGYLSAYKEGKITHYRFNEDQIKIEFPKL